MGDGVRCLKQIRIGVGYIITILSEIVVVFCKGHYTFESLTCFGILIFLPKT